MASNTTSKGSARAGVTLFAATSFASAFLIFLVQPLVGKHILPWFGGTPGVWMLCLAFYQTTLFLGYAYAHLLVRFVRPARQPLVHGLLFLAALAVLPVLPGEAWKPAAGAEPGGRILAMLGANVAVPFFLLASTGPLVQAWFGRALPGRSPYPLYAVSNLGSLLALVLYPTVIEPSLSLSRTSTLWSWSFGACAAAVLVCSLVAASRSAGEEALARGPGGRTRPSEAALWGLLAGCGVVQFMGVTNTLCLDIASVPFLWIVPLCVYLISFILGFGAPRLYRRRVYVTLWLACLLVLEAGTEWFILPDRWQSVLGSVRGQMVMLPLLLFLGCMLMHGELHRLRPEASRLTTFYLCISAGGALGGLFVGLAAPRVFTEYYELPLGLVMCWLLVLAAASRVPAGVTRRRRRGVIPTVAVLGAIGLSTMFALRSPIDHGRIRATSRNFFGIMRVIELARKTEHRRFHLQHGSTMHGVQYAEEEQRSEPTSYYGRITGIGLTLTVLGRKHPLKVGVIGLGIGTLAAYGRQGDHFTFYEIDPDVIAMAQDERFFDFVTRTRAEVEFVPGDGRLTLEAELERDGGRDFDLLVVDAFNSDAIPVHLLTMEAFRLYARHLKEGGTLAVHVSNRHFDLTPLVMRLGRELSAGALEIQNFALTHQLADLSIWIILSTEPEVLASIKRRGARIGASLDLGPGMLTFSEGDAARTARAPLWTDDHSDLFGLLKSSW